MTVLSSEIDTRGSSECLIDKRKELSMSPGSVVGAKYPRMGRLGAWRIKEHECPQVKSRGTIPISDFQQPVWINQLSETLHGSIRKNAFLQAVPLSWWLWRTRLCLEKLYCIYT